MFQKIELRKTRDFSAKINATFEFIRQNFKPLTKGLIFISGPFVLLQGLFNGIYQKETLAFDPTGSTGIFGFMGDFFLWFGLSLLFMMMGYISSIIVVNEFVRLYETKENPETIDVPEIWEGVKENFIRMLLAFIVVAITVTLATIFLIIPGIYVGVALSLICPIMIIERKDLGEAFSRCFSLITDKWWSTCGLIFVSSLIAGFMAFVFAIPQSIFTFLLAFHKTSDVTAEPASWEQVGLIISSMVYSFGANLLQSIVIIAVIFQFYNLVERKEAQGLLNKLENFGKTEGNESRHDETY